MPKQVRWRRGTTAEHATFTGAQGEVTVDITKKTLVVHDGVTPGGWPVNNTPGGGVSGQALTISAAGTDTITPGASVLNHFVDATVSAGAYLRKVVLSHVGAADGKRIAFHFTLPASANPVIELRDGSDTGTVLLAFSPRPDAAVPRSADCEYRGGAWRLVDSNEVADKIRESILDAKGRLPVRGATEVVALPAPGNGQMLVGNPNAPEGMNWVGVATARESLLTLYRERVANPSPLPVAVGANSIALGAGAYARGAGMVASANGGFNDQAATLQRWAVLLRNQTTDATQTELFADGVSQRLVLPDNYTWHVEVRVVAREQGGESAAYHFMGCIKRGTGAASVALVGSVDSPMGDKEDAAGWGVVVDADTTNGALRVRVTGGAAQTLRWGADVSVVEVFNAGGVAPPVLNDLVLFLKCEEASGTRFDSSGNDLHFSAVGGPLSGAGKIGAALALDGDGQMIEHTDDPLLRLTGDFTIAFWANFNAGNESVTLQRWGDNTTATVGIEWYAADGGVPGQQRLYAHLVGSAPSSVFLDFAPVVGTWYLIVLRVSGTTMKLSVNAGTPATGTASARADIARPTTFGGIWGMASFSAFNGRLDHIMQWNRALSDGEVAGLFNDGGGAIAWTHGWVLQRERWLRRDDQGISASFPRHSAEWD